MGQRTALEERLRQFKNKVHRVFPISKMVLFGSRARGNWKAESDIDLLIISSKFRGLDIIQRGSKMYDYWDLNAPVDFLCYTPREYDRLKKKISLVSQAVREGKEI